MRRWEKLALALLGVAAVAAAAGGTNWAAWVTAVATSVLATGVVFAWFAIQDAKRTRHAQLIMDLTQRWDQLVYREQLVVVFASRRLQALVRLVYGGQPSQRAIDEYLRLIQLPSLIETIGVLVIGQDVLDIEIVDQLWGEAIVDLWQRWTPAINEIRDRTDYPEAFDYFRQLAEALDT